MNTNACVFFRVAFVLRMLLVDFQLCSFLTPRITLSYLPDTLNLRRNEPSCFLIFKELKYSYLYARTNRSVLTISIFSVSFSAFINASFDAAGFASGVQR